MLSVKVIREPFYHSYPPGSLAVIFIFSIMSHRGTTAMETFQNNYNSLEYHGEISGAMC
jgi:hypothetical protein